MHNIVCNYNQHIFCSHSAYNASPEGSCSVQPQYGIIFQDNVKPKGLNSRKGVAMKTGIHPRYVKCIVTCACGNTFETRSTVEEIRTEICSACHPFFTGKQKIVDTEGRVEKFMAKYGMKQKDEQ